VWTRYSFISLGRDPEWMGEWFLPFRRNLRTWKLYYKEVKGWFVASLFSQADVFPADKGVASDPVNHDFPHVSKMGHTGLRGISFYLGRCFIYIRLLVFILSSCHLVL
jgi:hypothetical protein